MLNTKDMSAGSGKVKPIISVGNQVIKINSITLDQTPYDSDAYNVTLHTESEPVKGEFNGFLKDVNNPNGERYAGQVGRVRFSPYAYKDATLPSGREVQKDTEILKGMIFLSEVLGKRSELDMIEADTIEEFVTACNSLFKNSAFINACIGGREWQNKEGYTNHDLFLPRLSKDGVPLEALNTENSRLLTYNKADHLKELKTKETSTVESFEPSGFSKSDDTFDLS
tara:strand:- start:89 stop:766 length:678 start_codon:yes stop_codon:yes gene_type:complete